jgi:uncharacterized protein
MRPTVGTARSWKGTGPYLGVGRHGRHIQSAILACTLIFACAAPSVDEAASETPTPKSLTCSRPGQVWWNELLAGDAGILTAFYTEVIGWTTKAVNPQNTAVAAESAEDRYIIFMEGSQEAAGLINADHKDAVYSGKGWFTYIHVRDVDAAVAKVQEKGGTVVRLATTTAEGDRIAVVSDPLGNVFGLVTPANTGC